MKFIVRLQTFALVLLTTTYAFAEQGQTTAQSLAGQETTIPGGTLAFIAYLALWVLVFVLVMATIRRQRRADLEIAALEQRMNEVFDNPGD